VDLEGDVGEGCALVRGQLDERVRAVGGAVVEDFHELAQFAANGGLLAEAGNRGDEIVFAIAPNGEHESFEDATIASGQCVEGERLISRERWSRRGGVRRRCGGFG
jgi:hypothetical protein